MLCPKNIKTENEVNLKEEAMISFHVEKHYKLIPMQCRQDAYHLLVENTNPSGLQATINYYAVDLNKPLTRNPTKIISFEVFTKSSDFLLENSAISTTNHLVLFFNSILIYVELSSGKIVFKKDFTDLDLNMEYFLSPTNIFTTKLNNLTPIPSTNSLVALNNSNEIVLINYDFKSSTFKLIKSSTTDKDMKFESFKLNERYLLAFNKIKSKIYGYNLDCIVTRRSFDKFEFEVKVNDLTLYGFSSDLKHVFVVENKRLLEFYKYATNQRVAEMPLYIETKCVRSSEDFLVLAMKDRRVISYFIADTDRPNESYEKIKQLESRSIL